MFFPHTIIAYFVTLTNHLFSFAKPLASLPSKLWLVALRWRYISDYGPITRWLLTKVKALKPAQMRRGETSSPQTASPVDDFGNLNYNDNLLDDHHDSIFKVTNDILN